MYYGFTFNGLNAHCREGYKTAEGVLKHLEIVESPFKKALEIANLEYFEVHGPEKEINKLRPQLKDYGT